MDASLAIFILFVCVHGCSGLYYMCMHVCVHVCVKKYEYDW